MKYALNYKITHFSYCVLIKIRYKFQVDDVDTAWGYNSNMFTSILKKKKVIIRSIIVAQVIEAK